MVCIVLHEKDDQVGCSRFKYPTLSPSNGESFNFIVSPFFIVRACFFFFFLKNPLSNHFFFQIYANKNFTAPNLNLVDEPDLTKIHQSKIFLHTDGHLCAAHVILKYTPISSSFQSPKYVIKAKDPRLKQINLAVPGFLASPPPEGTHQVELLVQDIAKEKTTSSNPT